MQTSKYVSKQVSKQIIQKENKVLAAENNDQYKPALQK